MRSLSRTCLCLLLFLFSFLAYSGHPPTADIGRVSATVVAAADPIAYEMLSGKIDALQDQIGKLQSPADVNDMTPVIAPESVFSLNELQADTRSILEAIRQHDRTMVDGTDDGATDGLQLFNTLLLLLISAVGLSWYREQAR